MSSNKNNRHFEIEELKYLIEAYEGTLSVVSEHLKKIKEQLNDILDELQESIFNEEPPEDETIEKLEDIIKEIEKIANDISP